jgi:hypothetical protein
VYKVAACPPTRRAYMKRLKTTLMQALSHAGSILRLNRACISQIRIPAAWILLATQSILLGIPKAKSAVPPFASQPQNHLGGARRLTRLLPTYQYDKWDASFGMPSQHGYLSAALHPQGSTYNTLPIAMPWPNAHARFRTTTGTHHHHASFRDRRTNRLFWEYPYPSFRFKLYRRRYQPPGHPPLQAEC